MREFWEAPLQPPDASCATALTGPDWVLTSPETPVIPEPGEGPDIDTGNAIATIIVGIIAYVVVLVIIAVINGALGPGAAAVTGAFS